MNLAIQHVDLHVKLLLGEMKLMQDKMLADWIYLYST